MNQGSRESAALEKQTEYFSADHRGKARMKYTQCKPAPFATQLKYGQMSVHAKDARQRPSFSRERTPTSNHVETYETTFGQSYGTDAQGMKHQHEIRSQKNSGMMEEVVTKDWTTTQDAIGSHFSGGESSGAKAALVQQRSRVKGTLTHDQWSTTQREVGKFEEQELPATKGPKNAKEDFFPDRIDFITTQQTGYGQNGETAGVLGKRLKEIRRMEAKDPKPFTTTSQGVGSHASAFAPSATARTEERKERLERSKAEEPGTKPDSDVLGKVDSQQELAQMKEYSENVLGAFNGFMMPSGMNRSAASKVQTDIAYAPKHVAYKVRKKLQELNMEHVLEA